MKSTTSFNTSNKRSHLSLSLIHFFFGLIGLDDFYMKNYKLGKIKILLGVVTLFFIYLADVFDIDLLPYLSFIPLLILWFINLFKIYYGKSIGDNEFEIADENNRNTIFYILLILFGSYLGLNDHYLKRKTKGYFKFFILLIIFLFAANAAAEIILLVLLFPIVDLIELLFNDKLIDDELELNNDGDKFYIPTLILSQTGGFYGLDRFYQGDYLQAIIKLVVSLSAILIFVLKISEVLFVITASIATLLYVIDLVIIYLNLLNVKNLEKI